MKKKKMRKYISGILSFCLVFTQLPAIAFAAPAEEMQKMPSKATAVMEESSENMTTFDLGDGLKQAVFYGSDVRFLSEDGRLTDYEPELVKVRDNKSETGKDLSDFAWKNKKGDSWQYFPASLSSETPVLMEKGDYAIAMAAADISFQNGQLQEEKRETPYEAVVTEDLTAAYTSEDESLSISYTSLNQGVKETIVLEERPEKSTFTFSLKLEGLVPELSERMGYISLKDRITGKPAAYICAPFMNDAGEQAYSRELNYEIKSDLENADTYILKLHVSKEYLDDPERVYPVTIDPTLIWTGDSMAEAAYIDESNPDENYDGMYALAVGGEDRFGGPYCGLIRFKDITSLNGVSVSNAVFEIAECNTIEGRTANVLPITSSWEADTVTWNTRPTRSSAVGSDEYEIYFTGYDFDVHTIDLTDCVTQWINGQLVNNGIMLISDEYAPATLYGPGNTSQYMAKLIVTFAAAAPTAPASIFTQEAEYGELTGSAYFMPGQTVFAGWNGISSPIFDKAQYKITAANSSTPSPSSVGQNHVNLTVYQDFGVDKASASGIIIPYSDELPEGTYTLHVRGVDLVGQNGSAKTVNFYVDDTPPMLEGLSVNANLGEGNKGDSADFPSTITTPQISWTASDTHFQSVSLSINGGEETIISTSAGIRTYTLPASSFPAEGIYSITLKAEDKAGNTSAETLYYSVDTVKPVIKEVEISPQLTSSDNLNHRNPRISWKAEEPFFSHMEYRVNGGTYSTIGEEAAGVFDVPSSVFASGTGTYTFTFRAVDKAGNTSNTVSRTYYLGSSGSYLPQDLAVSESYGKRIVTWNMDACDTANYAYDLHRGSSASFTPSDSTLVAQNVNVLQGYYADGDILADGTYWYKFVVRNTEGNAADQTTAGVSFANAITEEDFENHTGFQDYRSYFEFGTPTGTGYIEKSSGNVLYEQDDYAVSNAQLDYGLSRTYSSMNAMTGMLGTGWSDSYHKELYFNGSKVYFADSDGSILTFTASGSTYTCAESMEYTLEKNSSGWILTDKENTAYTFDDSGRLLKTSEPNGCQIANTYDHLGRLEKVTSKEAHSVKHLYFTYSGESSLLASVTDFAGTTYSYSYSGKHLTAVTVSGGSDSVTYRYGYSSAGLLNKVYDALNNLYEIGYTDSKGSLIEYPNGDTHSLTYTPAQKKTTVSKKNAAGKVLYTESMTYDSEGRVVSETDAAGSLTEYAYVTQTGLSPYLLKEMKETVFYQSLNGNTVSLDETMLKVTTCSYDSAGNLISETTDYRETSAPGTAGTVTESSSYQYEDNKVISEIHKNNGEKTEHYVYSYAAENEPVLSKSSSAEPQNRGNLVGSADYITDTRETIFYDEDGREVLVTETGHEDLDITSENGAVVSETETGYNLVTGSDGTFEEEVQNLTKSGGVVSGSTESYDAMGRAIRQCEDENITVNTYDFLGRITKTVTTLADGSVQTQSYTYNGNGSLVSETNERGITTAYTYDNMNRKLGAVTTGPGIEKSEKWTAYSYTDSVQILSGNGTALASGTPLYVETVSDKQTGGNVLSVSYTGGEGHLLREDYGTMWTCYDYDQSGNRILTYSGNSAESTLTLYDKEGRETHSIAAPSVSGSTFSKGSSSITTSQTYDVYGNVSAATDANGSVMHYEYNAEGQLLSCGEEGAENTVSYTDISADSDYGVVTVTDANGNQKIEKTDAAGLTVQTKDWETGNYADKGSIVKNYVYDRKGNLTRESYGDNSFILYTYDEKDQLTAKTSYSSTGEESAVTYTYNDFGEMTGAVTARNGNTVSSYAWTYDVKGSMLSESVSYGTGSSQTTSYTYDSEGRLKQTVYPADSGLGTLTYSYDSLGNVKSVSRNGQKIAEYVYDSQYRETAVKEYVTAGSSSYMQKNTAYGVLDRVSSITYTKNGSASNVLESYTYSYDKAGNITKRVRTDHTGTETRNYTYGGYYDALTATSITEGSTASSISYVYDAAGNRTSMTENGKTTTYTYNGLNQLTKKTDSKGTTNYKYDLRGNQTEEKGPGLYRKYVYLVTGELAEVRNGAASMQKNTYNHEGIRISREESGDVRQYFHDRGSVAYTKDNGSISSANIRGLDGSIISSARGSSSYLHTEDIQGSTGTILDSSFQNRNTYDYADFGEVTVSGTSQIENEICYTGAVYDETTGLHYLNARYYDPENGRFISQDSYRGELGDYAQWHLYAYCANNPVNYVDPSGHAKNNPDNGKTTLPPAGTKLWLCIKTTKQKLRENIAPYFKREHPAQVFLEWGVGEAQDDLISQMAKTYGSEAVKEFFKGIDTWNSYVFFIEKGLEIGKFVSDVKMYSIWKKIDKFYKDKLKKKKDSKTVYYCHQLSFKRQGKSDGYFKPTGTIKLSTSSNTHDSFKRVKCYGH